MATDQNTPREEVVTDLSPVFKLIEEPKFAELYAHLRDEPATIPELLPDLRIEKSTAYNYVTLLKQAGLVTEIGTRDGSSLYKTEEFHVTIRISETEINVTPELAHVIAQQTANPEVDRFIDQYGLSTLAEFIPLAQQYADGEMTHRAISEILGISHASAFEMLRETLEVLDIAPASTHSQPGDYSDEEVETLAEESVSPK